VKEAVAEKVAEAFEALDAAAAAKVDQIMGPVNDLAAQADAVGQAMNDATGGDLGAVGSAADLAQSMSDAIPKPSSLVQGALGDLLPAGWGGAEPEAAETAGSGGGEGGGESGANEAGPAAGVSATTDSDDSCGPGHAILDAGATHDEKVSSLRVVITAGKVTTTTTGARTSDAGAAKVELIAGSRTEACDATKDEKAVGLIVLAGGDETETIEGDRSTKVGGAIVDKVSGNATLSAGGTLKMAGAFVRVKASGSIILKCGGSEVAIAGGGIKLSATLIQIAAAKITEKSTTAAGA
jgi:type VI secretion system secreted protein VgrG